ncbi:protein FAM83H [Aulostomus maculatus]
MARRSQCSSAGDNPLDSNYLPPHYREEYRLAIDTLVEEDLEAYYEFLQRADVVDFLSTPEIQYIQNSVQVPQQSTYQEHPYVETGGDGSSDTYWPIHSDLDAPGLDLGWPQLHHFGGPTEVTTLVNPPEPDMPSIKEQARRLIKNAQQVVAIVMDMFTDVDMFADIINAAMRNVAVYILLDERNAHQFVNMVSNCRVNLQHIQFLRVRTVSGITYRCRSGKSFEGQMMDRFLLTDCRAVLSGNYSFMWSFEKLHRCMAHLFFGQLVSTFDEEFRILFAQSQPLMLQNVPVPMDESCVLQKRQYPSKKLYREPRKFRPVDSAHSEEWARHSYDERMDPDWRMMTLKRQEAMHGPVDIHSRFPSQPSRLDQPFDQGQSRLPMMEFPAFKRHSYAEGGHGRYPYPFPQQQGLPDLEIQGRHRGQQLNVGPGPEADYSGSDKFWNQDYHSADQYSEPDLPLNMEPPDNFDPVLNYLSSTRNVDFDQCSEKLQLPVDMPFGSSHPRRSSAGQAYACQTSPTPSNPTDEKQFFQEPNTDRKDPMVKRGLRNWRINSYLSGFDNPGDEGRPLTPPQAPDPFEEPSKSTWQMAPGIDVSVTKIPNVREFKVPALPRASQMPSYAKTTAREQSKKLPEGSTAVPAETKTTPTPSESSSTTEDKLEEAEQKEPNIPGLRREDSFRRKYNVAVPRGSRLRSSLIFSSLDQQSSQDTKTGTGQDEESDKNENEQTKIPFAAQVLGQRRSAREPFEWKSYIKSATYDNSAPQTSKPDDGTSKAEDKDSSNVEKSKDNPENPDALTSLKPPNEEQGNEPKTKPSVQPHKSFLTNTPSFVDMNDPDKRFMFFKELAAKRKAAKAAEEEKSTAKTHTKSPTDLKNAPLTKEEPPCQEPASLPVSAETPQSDLPEKPKLPKPVELCPCEPPTEARETPANFPSLDSTSRESCSLTPSSEVLTSSSASTPQNPESLQSGPSIPNSLLPSESSAGTKLAPSSTPDVPTSSFVPQVSNTSPTSTSVSPNSYKLEPKKSPSFSPSTEDSTQKSSASPVSLTAQLDSTSHSTSDVSCDKRASDSEPKTSSLQSSSEKSCSLSLDLQRHVTASGTSPVQSPVSEGSPKDIKALGTPPSQSPSSLEVCLPDKSILKRSLSKPDKKDPTPADLSSVDSQSDAISTVTPDSCKSEAIGSPKQPFPSGLNLTESGVPPPSETLLHSPLSESVGSIVSPEAEKTDTNMPVLRSSSDTNSPANETPTDSEKVPVHPLMESSLSPTEPTSIVQTDSDLPNKSHKSDESHSSESSSSADNGYKGTQVEECREPCEKRTEDSGAIMKVNKTTKQDSIDSEKTNDQVEQSDSSKLAETLTGEVPLSPQSKPKSSQSRYHSSTANVLSSSNLRDDTKLLLEQISANSQSRSESTKECPVTDDEKEDEADKNAKRGKERGSLGQGQSRTTEERDKLLERIQSMRKERRVYSRFEMAP